MKTFYYRARNRSGSLVSQAIEATDLKEAKKKIFQLNLVPIEVTSVRKKTFVQKLQTFLDKFGVLVPQEDFVVFNRQFQSVFSVGIPLERGLTLIEEQTENVYLKKAVADVIADLRSGRSLYEAFSRHPKIFNETYCNLIRAGEAAGKLDSMLERLSSMNEEQNELRGKVKSAVFYPKIVSVMFCISFVVLFTFVIPKLKTFYDQFHTELPFITRQVIAVSNFCAGYWYLMVIAFLAGYFGLRSALATEKGRVRYDRIKLRMPVFGKLEQLSDAHGFCSTLELLLNGGVPIVEALRLTRASLKNQIFKNEVTTFIRAVEHGGGLAPSLSKSEVFPKIVGGFVAVGEETGDLSGVLTRVSNYYQMQLKFTLDRLTKAIEPLLLVIVFAGVFVMILAVFLPIWKMSSIVTKH